MKAPVRKTVNKQINSLQICLHLQRLFSHYNSRHLILPTMTLNSSIVLLKIKNCFMRRKRHCQLRIQQKILIQLTKMMKLKSSGCVRLNLQLIFLNQVFGVLKIQTITIRAYLIVFTQQEMKQKINLVMSQPSKANLGTKCSSSISTMESL